MPNRKRENSGENVKPIGRGIEQLPKATGLMQQAGELAVEPVSEAADR